MKCTEETFPSPDFVSSPGSSDHVLLFHHLPRQTFVMCLGNHSYVKPVAEKLLRTLWCPCERVTVRASFHRAGVPPANPLLEALCWFWGARQTASCLLKTVSLFLLQTLGHIGKVIKVYGDGDLRVSVGGQSWTFNPACLTAYQRDEEANLMTTENAKESKSELVRTAMSDLAGTVKWLRWCDSSNTLWTVLNSSCLFFSRQSSRSELCLTREAKLGLAGKYRI